MIDDYPSFTPNYSRNRKKMIFLNPYNKMIISFPIKYTDERNLSNRSKNRIAMYCAEWDPNYKLQIYKCIVNPNYKFYRA